MEKSDEMGGIRCVVDIGRGSCSLLEEGNGVAVVFGTSYELGSIKNIMQRRHPLSNLWIKFPL